MMKFLIALVAVLLCASCGQPFAPSPSCVNPLTGGSPGTPGVFVSAVPVHPAIASPVFVNAACGATK